MIAYSLIRKSARGGLASALVLTSACGLAETAPVAPPLATANGTPCKQDYISRTGRVIDGADLLNAEQESRIAAHVEAMETDTAHQMVVVTVTSLQGKPVEDYTICLANHWGIGRKDVNDGLVFLIAPVERKARIEVGYGLEAALTDAEAAAIMSDRIIPEFRQGKMANGIAAGVDAIIKEIS
jgi:uncharacterized protein